LRYPELWYDFLKLKRLMEDTGFEFKGGFERDYPALFSDCQSGPSGSSSRRAVGRRER
jgi:hypothetical protein